MPIPLPGAEGVYVKVLKAFEGLSLGEAANIDAQSLVEVILPAV